MHYTKVNDIPGILLAVDFRKAFDCVSWDFLECTLRKVGYGPMLVKWIKTFYTNITSCIINNGQTSKYFPIYQGVRQGDPLSAYLFLLVVEVLASKIRSDTEIRSIDEEGKISKILQYADDTNGLVRDIQSAQRFLELVENFGKFSNLYMNKDKTQGMWLGQKRASKLQPLGIKWPEGPLKLLGIHLSYDDEACNILNYDKKIAKCKQIINWWQSRNLTLLGRIQIIKTFITSQFQYVMGVTEIPKKYVSEINNMIKAFVWRSKKCKLKQSVMCKDKLSGGLKMPDFNTMIEVSHIKWMKRVIMHKDSLCWTTLCLNLSKCNIKNIDLFLKANYDVNWIKQSMPPFYVQVLRVWHEHVQTNPSRECMLWYNRMIQIGGKHVYYEEFVRAGIVYVQDLLDTDGKFVSFAHCIEKGISKQSWFHGYR